jgi:predicted ATPase
LRTCRAIAQEIAGNVDILTTRLRNLPERHRSIRAAFEHSWQLLTVAERKLFSHLSVFHGGFDDEAALSVTGASLPILRTLLDKSLLRRIAEHRYDMHELLRQYAAEILEADPAACMAVRAGHARYYADFLVAQATDLVGRNQQQVLMRVAVEIENVRQAWQFAVEQGWCATVTQCLGSLYMFYRIRARFEEGVALFSYVIEQ